MLSGCIFQVLWLTVCDVPLTTEWKAVCQWSQKFSKLIKYRLPNPNKDQYAQSWYCEKKHKETLYTDPMQRSISDLWIPDGNCVSQADCGCVFEPAAEILLNDLCTYWNEPAGYWCWSQINEGELDFQRQHSWLSSRWAYFTLCHAWLKGGGGGGGGLELGIYLLPWPMALKQNDYSSHFLLNDFGTSPYPAL